MHTDRYGNPLTSGSVDATEAYCDGLDCLLAATAGMEEAFQRAVDLDDQFALGHLGLARSRRILGMGGDVSGPLERARKLSSRVCRQEQSLIHCLGLLLEGDSVGAWAAIQLHVSSYPRDVLAVQPSTGVFGLIGFSGRPGREQEHREWCASLAPHFGKDWWFLAQLGFAQVESGDVSNGRLALERSLELNPHNANAAHYYGHALYEQGQHQTGSDWLGRWITGYDAMGPMNCHLQWHLALWALYLGEPDRMRAIWASHIVPEKAIGPPINVLTDGVSLLHRAKLAGQYMPSGAWNNLAEYANRHFPSPGVSFADVHRVLACAMAGDDVGVGSLRQTELGPAADLVSAMARIFEAFAEEDWSAVVTEFGEVMPNHARIGGSRAQRDLIEHTLAFAMNQVGDVAGARSRLSDNRPEVLTSYVIEGLMPMPGSTPAESVEP